MNNARILSRIGLATMCMLAIGCAGSKPAASMAQDDKPALQLRHDTADQVAPPTASSRHSNTTGYPVGRDGGTPTERDGMAMVHGRSTPSAAGGSSDLGRPEVETQLQQVPSPAPSESKSANTERPAQASATVVQTHNPTATDVRTPQSATTRASQPEIGPSGPAPSGTAAVRSIDAGWGPAPTKAGKLGVVRPATRPIDIDPTLVDAIKLPDGDPRKVVIGIWEQVNGDNDSDFAHGDYSKSFLTFRNDGVLDIARFYGPRGEVRLNRQLVFRVEGSTIVLATTQGADTAATDLSLAAGLNGTTIVARKPKSALPAKLDYSIKQDTLAMDGRSYKRVQPVVTSNP